MKEMELGGIKELINIYETLYNSGLTEYLSEKAKSIYNELTPGHTLLSKDVNSAVGKLFSVAYPNVDRDRKIPTKKDIIEILITLKKRKQELEK